MTPADLEIRWSEPGQAVFVWHPGDPPSDDPIVNAVCTEEAPGRILCGVGSGTTDPGLFEATASGFAALSLSLAPETDDCGPIPTQAQATLAAQ